MLRIRVMTRLVAAGAAAMTVPTAVGCTAPAGGDFGQSSDDVTNAVAGSGAIAIRSYGTSYESTSGGDEFIRVGEKMTVSVPLASALDTLRYRIGGPQAALTALLDELKKDPSKMNAEVEITYTNFDGSTTALPAMPLTWAPPPSGSPVVGQTVEFTIPKGVRGLRVLALARIAGQQNPAALNARWQPDDFVVFGAYLPNKLALFDTQGATMRTRIVEGGGVVKGSDLTFAYTDYRLDTLCDKLSLDLRTGRVTNFNRFGPSIVDELGKLAYEIEAVVSTDGGATFESIGFAETPDSFTTRNDGARRLWQASKKVPASASGNAVQIAFRVRAYLEVPTGPAAESRYPRGARILLKEVWDNNGGANYALPFSAQ